MVCDSKPARGTSLPPPPSVLILPLLIPPPSSSFLPLSLSSGCIALSLLHALPLTWRGVACDISSAALRVARINDSRLRRKTGGQLPTLITNCSSWGCGLPSASASLVVGATLALSACTPHSRTFMCVLKAELLHQPTHRTSLHQPQPACHASSSPSLTSVPRRTLSHLFRVSRCTALFGTGPSGCGLYPDVISSAARLLLPGAPAAVERIATQLLAT